MGREGAEHIADAIGALVRRRCSRPPTRNGGGLLKFGGDALLLFFDGDEHAERGVPRGGAHARARCAPPAAIEAPGARVTLRMSVGIHSDALHLFLVGGSHREPVVARPGRVRGAADGAGGRAPGDIVVSPADARRCSRPGRSAPPAGGGPAPAQRARRRGGPRGRRSLGGAAARSPAAACPPPCARHLGEAGRRPSTGIVTIAFLRFGGDGHARSRAHGTGGRRGGARRAGRRDVQAAADEHEVAFLGSDVDVDGGKLLLCAGAPRAVGDDEERMLRTLRAHRGGARRRLPVQIGVNRGRAFTGDIGPPYRRTYTAMGDVVNLAARLMAARARRARSTRRRACSTARATRFATTELEPLALKGKARPRPGVGGRPRARLARAASERPRGAAAARGPRARARACSRDALAAARARRGPPRRAGRRARHRQDAAARGGAPAGAAACARCTRPARPTRGAAPVQRLARAAACR